MSQSHLLTLADITPAELTALLALAATLKAERGNSSFRPLAGKTVALIFSKASTRTRVSFEVGIQELGGNPIFLSAADLQLGRGEPMSDTAQVLSRYIHGAVIRTHAHADIIEFADSASIPVINALTDDYHPCQLLADLQTIAESAGRIEGVKVAYLGDGASNMARSWALAAYLSGIDLHIGAPDGYQLDLADLPDVPQQGSVTITDDVLAAAADADFVYTDVWVSMGFEAESQERLQDLQPYQVNARVMAAAKPDCKVLHCLPAHRGQEITADVLDGPQSIIWDEAENRLHAQKAVLAHLLG
ncbi:MAG: ornithine carbamoyltransferase [Rhodothermales bacterium]|jgi:ornithine carbamoyltransferase